MPDVLPTINNEPAQGIQAQLDTVYLWNPDVANGLIEQVNELLAEIGELENLSGKIKPYSQMTAPVPQYMPTTYNDGLYVANSNLSTLPATFDPTQWTLIATKIDRTAITQEINTAVGDEARLRASSDNNLQSQIDAISASSDVKDIVGTYAELEDYDTSKLGNNDIIKVLQDETQNDATTYYRWSTTDEQFSLIGSEGPYYTKSQTDVLLGDKQDTLIAGEGITIENNVISSTGGASGDFVPQYETMPAASSENVGTLVQYSGPTTENTKPSATGVQTVGSGIGSITVDVNTFEQAEQPTGDETITFVANVSGTGGFAPVAEIGTSGNYAYFNTAKMCAYIAQYTDHTDYKYVSVRHNSSNSNSITMYMNSGAFPNSWGGYTTYKQISNITDSDLENDVGITLSNYEYTSSTKAQSDWSDATIEWTRDGAPVNLVLYGISIGGVPTDGSEIEITYTAFKYGYGHGYFYTCSEDYSDPTLRVEQSSGSDLFNITIGFDTFVEKEQPTGNEILNFTYDTIPGSFEYTTESGFEGLTIDTEGIVAELVNQGYENYVANFTSGGIDRDENDGYVISVYSNRYWQTITMNVDSYISGSASDYGRVAVITSMSPQVTGWFDEDEVAVTPSEYGVSYDGEPTGGDVLTIYYTAPAFLGYVWDQTNVQPSGKIEWTKKWVNDVSGATDRALYPIFDALEDGQYEWYYTVGTQDAYTVRYQTFKAEFAIRHEGNNFYLSGTLNWIIDGSTSFNGGNMLSNMYALYASRNSARTLFTMKTIYVNVGGYSAVNTPLFMCTDVKNVKTGETFPVKIETEEPNFSSNIGELNTGYPVDVNINSSNSDWAVITTTEMATYVGLRFQVDNDACEFIIRAYCGNDQFEATMRNVGTFDKKRWVARIDRATGILSGAYIAQNIWGDNLYMYHGITSSNDALHAQGTRIGMNVKQNWVGWSGEQNLPDGSYIILCTTVNVGNTVTPDNYGLIEQYTGATNANYTNGYFYKAVGTPVITPASMTSHDVSPNDCDVTVDADDFVAAVVNWTGWTRETVISHLSDNYQFQIYWDANNNNVTRVYWGAYGDFNEDSGIPALFSVTTTGTYYGTVILYVYFTYTAEGTEIQNGHWERTDVQPGGSSLPSQTGQSGKFLTTDGTDASWSDKPLVNKAPNDRYSLVVSRSGSLNTYPYYSIVIVDTLSPFASYGSYSITLGYSNARASGHGSIAIGYNAKTSAINAIEIASGNFGYTNSDANTFKVGNENGNFEIMSADGTVPTARLTKVNTTITLAAADWAGGSQTVSVTGMTATGVVFVSPDPSDQADYTSAGILCTAQAAGTLTFTCDTTPTNDIDVVVVMM